MKRLLLYITVPLFMLYGCGNGTSGGPSGLDKLSVAEQKLKQEEFYRASGGENALNSKELIIDINGKTDTVIPKFRKKGQGSNIIFANLRKGVNMFRLSYSSYSENDSKISYVNILKGEDKIAFFALESKEDLGASRKLEFINIEKAGRYTIDINTIDAKDAWDIAVIHESELSVDARRGIKIGNRVSKEEDSDILYKYQWHLKNTGQEIEVLDNAVAGEDINVEPVWKMGYTGKGVVVAVVDEGVEINHPDLLANMLPEKCHNYLTQLFDTTPTNPHNAHGTAVAGIIAAKGWNGIGGRGVAPNASIISLNLLEGQGIVSWPLAYHALTKQQKVVDIYNNSWGYPASGQLFPNANSEDSPYDGMQNQLANGAKFGRKGKGSIFVKSAGNDRMHVVNGKWKNNWNANFDPDQVERYMIVVGASGADGHYSEYSNPGANLLVNAGGGDTNAPYLKLDEHQIITSDLSSKYMGYDYRDPSTGLDFHFDYPGNENFDYTNRMNGTSSAGPIVSGVIALMLEANPKLGWRDVRYILALTARKNGSGYIANAAGRSFSNDYGFGIVDAQAAVKMALGHKNLLVERPVLSSYALSHESDISNDFAYLHREYNLIDESMKIEYVNIEMTLEAVAEDSVEFKSDDEKPTKKIEGGVYRAVFELTDARIYSPESDNDELYDDKLVNVTLNCGSGGQFSIFSNLRITDGIIPEEEITGVGLDVDKRKCSVRITAITGEKVADYAKWNLKLEKGDPLPDSGNIEVTLISPSGTKSKIIDAPNGLNAETAFIKTRFGTNAFMDEDANGVWQLDIKEVSDFDNPKKDDDTRAFKAKDLRLEVYGR